VMLLLFSSGDALQCYQGQCSPGASPCSDEMSLQKVTCPQGFTMCMKQTSLLNWRDEMHEMKTFGCAHPKDGPAEQLGIEDGGCADPKEVLKNLLATQPNAGGPGGIGAALLDQMSDMEMCLCDTSLCNAASKKAFATFFGFLFFFLLNIII